MRNQFFLLHRKAPLFQGLAFLVNTISFGNSSHFYSIAFTLEHRATFCKFNRLVYRLCFYDDISANRFLDLSKGTISHNLVVSHHSAVIEWEAVPTTEFILGCNAADPVHCLFHPNLDLFGRRHLLAILVSEN